VVALDDAGLSATGVVTANVFASQFVNGSSLGNSNLSWSTWGWSPWFQEASTTHDGISAMQSGHITDLQESWLTTSAVGPGRLSFWWKASSEPGFDFLELYLDGILQEQVSGESGWIRKVYNIPFGTNTLGWRYAKDPDTLAGQDAGFLDEVKFDAGVWLELAAPPVRGNVQLLAHGIIGHNYALQGSTNLIDWSVVTSFTATNTATILIDSSTNQTRFYRLRDLSAGGLALDTPKIITGSVQLTFRSPAPITFAVQSSTNLTDWLTLGTLTNNTGIVSYVVPFSPSGRQFYRGKLVF